MSTRPRIEPGVYSTLTLRQCAGLLKPIMKLENATYFLHPVDAEALRIPDYHHIVKEPMDLGTIETRLDAGRYPSVEDFITDVKLVWYNAYLYNKPGSVVHDAAQHLETVFDNKLEALVASSTGAGTPSADGADVVPHTLIRPIIKSLQSHALSKPFRVPVDYVALQLPQYPQLITRPMDLLTVATNLEQGVYDTVGKLRRDIEQIWRNCQEFNGVSSWLGEHAETLRQFTQKKFAQAAIADAAAISYTGGGGASPARHRRPGLPLGASRLPAAPVHAPKPAPSGRPAPPVPPAVPPAAGSACGMDDVEMTLGQCRALLKPFLVMPSAAPFLEPVDPVQLNIPDYPLVVTHPMDLGTIQDKLNRNQYSSASGFVSDMRLVWGNAILYNPAGTPVHISAAALSAEFERQLVRMVDGEDGLAPAPLPPKKALAPSRPAGVVPAPQPVDPPLRPPPRPAAPPRSAPAVPSRPAPPAPSPSAAPAAPAAPASACPPLAGAAGAESEPALSRSQHGQTLTTAPVKLSAPKPPAPRSHPAASYLPSGGEASGAQKVRSIYRKTVNHLRNHPQAVPFKVALNWKKAGFLDYPNIISRPMDLGTVAKKLERCEYATAHALLDDVDLVWDNAIKFNGADSWIGKVAAELREIANAKLAHAEAAYEQAQNTPSGGSGDAANALITSRDGSKVLTPQMRLQFHGNAKRLRPTEMLEMQRLVRQCCPAALSDIHTGDVKIDVDALHFQAFIRLDVYVRSILVQRV